MSRRKRKPLPPSIQVDIESLTSDGRGIAHHDGKAIFVDGALPEETVSIRYTAVHRQHDEAMVEEVIVASPTRIEPKCLHAAICGGCTLQHLKSEDQVAYKQQAAIDLLARIGKVTPLNILEPIQSESWGYRHKARVGVKYVNAKERVLIGFREKRNHFLADIEYCQVLHPSVGEKLPDIASLIQSLNAYQRIPQIEVAVAEQGTALIVRHLDPLVNEDIEKLSAFAQEYNYFLFLQSKGPNTVKLLWPEQVDLSYKHAKYDVTVNFKPQDFFQINPEVNEKMVAQAIDYLQLTETDKVLDLYCGLGNFTLPIAKHVASVIGVEGDHDMVQRAKENALMNDITNTDYYVANLMEDIKGAPWLDMKFDKVLLDPPRSGAKEMIKHIDKISPSRVVYVSCDPATLARDAGMLVNEFGFSLEHFGIMNMFPHTGHVESMAVFTRK